MTSQMTCGANPTLSSARWVDLIGSDDDTLSGPEDFQAPITEDSYQGKPNPALDGSKSDTLQKLRLDEPLDFGFLFQKQKEEDKAEAFPPLDQAVRTPKRSPTLKMAKALDLDGTDSTTNTISTP